MTSPEFGFGTGLPSGLYSLSLRLLETFFDHVLLEHGELPHVLSVSVHLNLGHLPGVLGASIRTMYSHSDPLKVIGWWGGWVCGP